MPDATSEASEVRLGKTAAASSSASKYGCARSAGYTCIRPNRNIDTYKAVAHQRRSDNGRGDRVHANTVGAEEVGHAGGDTEHTGYGWSASSRNYFDSQTCHLTLGRAICKATSGDWPSDGRGNVDDAAPLLLGAGTKRSLVGVLAVNGVRDDGVDREGAVGIHVEHLGEVLTRCTCVKSGSAPGIRILGFLTFAESTSLWDQVRDGAMAAQ